MNQAVGRYQEELRRPEGPGRDAMIRAYLPLVRKVAHRICRGLPPGIDVNDLIASGCVGLISALERFDPSRGLDFGSFAEFRVKGAILDELRALDPVPRRSRKQLQHLEKVRRKLQGTLGRPPVSEEMAEELNMSVSAYQELEGHLTPGIEMSLVLLNQEKELSASESSANSLPADRILQKEELRQSLVRAIRCLPERLRTVISLYYYSHLSYKEIALLYDVTESRVCQMHREAVSLMRDDLDRDEQNIVKER